MAASTISSGNVVTRFQNSVIREYVRGGRFGPYTGASENSIFQVNRDLKKHSIPLVGKISGAGKKGSQTLSGNETPLSNYDFIFTPTYHREAVKIDNEENEKAEFDLFREARPALMNWAMELKRDHSIQALGAVWAGGTYYNYGGTEGSTNASAASAANMDTWNTNNEDRILYGNAVANYSAGDHTASLAAIATDAADRCTRAGIELMKQRAEIANPLIRPIMVNGDEPMYVAFMDPYAWRDLRSDLDGAFQNALPRSLQNNPIWSGGDLLVDNVVCKRVPEIATFIDGAGDPDNPFSNVWGSGATGDDLTTASATSSRMSPVFFCGAQAVAHGIGRMPSFETSPDRDYNFVNKVAVQMKHDVRKIFFNNKQHGMLTGFVAATIAV